MATRHISGIILNNNVIYRYFIGITGIKSKNKRIFIDTRRILCYSESIFFILSFYAMKDICIAVLPQYPFIDVFWHNRKFADDIKFSSRHFCLQRMNT